MSSAQYVVSVHCVSYYYIVTISEKRRHFIIYKPETTKTDILKAPLHFKSIFHYKEAAI